MLFNFGMGASKLKRFLHQFLGRVATAADGTRYLVNEGEGDNVVMPTGQGAYFNGQDSYIDTGFVPDLTQDFTYFGNIPYVEGKTYGLYAAPNVRLHFEIYQNKFLVGVGNTYKQVTTDYTGVTDIHFAVTYQSSSGLVSIELSNLNVTDSFTASVPTQNTIRFFIGARSDTNSPANYIQGSLQAQYFIPKALTPAERQAHYNNPEQTLYWDNGVLKSDILDQATIDSMQAGNGFWYPLTDKGPYYRNHALPIPGNLVTSAFTPSDATWIVDGENFTSNSTTGYAYVQADCVNTGVDDVFVEIKISNYVSGSVRIQLSLGDVNADSGVYTSNGVYRVKIAAQSNTVIRVQAVNGFVGEVELINFYPLANSGLTPLVNWTSTTSTNASQLSTGYQCALVEQDAFGLPTNPVTIDVKADSLADAQAQFLSENGLTLTDNAGTLELYK